MIPTGKNARAHVLTHRRIIGKLRQRLPAFAPDDHHPCVKRRIEPGQGARPAGAPPARNRRSHCVADIVRDGRIENPEHRRTRFVRDGKSRHDRRHRRFDQGHIARKNADAI